MWCTPINYSHLHTRPRPHNFQYGVTRGQPIILLFVLRTFCNTFNWFCTKFVNRGHPVPIEDSLFPFVQMPPFAPYTRAPASSCLPGTGYSKEEVSLISPLYRENKFLFPAQRSYFPYTEAYLAYFARQIIFPIPTSTRLFRVIEGLAIPFSFASQLQVICILRKEKAHACDKMLIGQSTCRLIYYNDS